MWRIEKEIKDILLHLKHTFTRSTVIFIYHTVEEINTYICMFTYVDIYMHTYKQTKKSLFIHIVYLYVL
jgi:hypothetical protein